MKVFIVAIVSILVLMSGATTGFAQQDDRHRGARDGHHRGGRDHGPRNPDRMLERMTRHLDLDDLQQEKLRNIMMAAEPELDALRERSEANRDAHAALNESDSDYASKVTDIAAEKGEIVTEREIVMGRVRSEIHAELTEEQIAKIAERGDRKGRHRRWREMGKTGEPGQ